MTNVVLLLLLALSSFVAARTFKNMLTQPEDSSWRYLVLVASVAVVLTIIAYFF